jgi:hypothetical protein
VQVQESDVNDLKILPKWVKCMFCGGKPTEYDYLVEVVQHSSALAHQSCLLNRGKIAGIDIKHGEN